LIFTFFDFEYHFKAKKYVKLKRNEPVKFHSFTSRLIKVRVVGKKIKAVIHVVTFFYKIFDPVHKVKLEKLNLIIVYSFIFIF